MVRLPLSGIEVEFVRPTGAQELLLAGEAQPDLELALRVARQLARPVSGEANWDELPLIDFDALFLRLRQELFGDSIRAEAVCPAAGCGKRIDAQFSVADYLEHHRPQKPNDVVPGSEPGWWRLLGAEFRSPAVADLRSVRGIAAPGRALASRCLRPPNLSAAVRRRVEAAMGLMAPSLSDDVRAVCPECGAAIELRFDPPTYVLQELRATAVGIHEEVHLLAATYHWSEAEILALPGGRRRRYVELILDERGSV